MKASRKNKKGFLICFTVVLTLIATLFATSVFAARNSMSEFSDMQDSEGRTFSAVGQTERLIPIKDLTELPLTFEAVIKYNSGLTNDQAGTIFGNYYNGSNVSLNFEMYKNSQPALCFKSGTKTVDSVIFANAADAVKASYGDFFHLAITVKETATAGKYDFACYVNGVHQQTITKAAILDITEIQSNYKMSLGTNGAGKAFLGNIRSLSIYNRTLSAEEIVSSHENGTDLSTRGLIASYDMTDASHLRNPSFEKDVSGNGYHLQKSKAAGKWFTSDVVDNPFYIQELITEMPRTYEATIYSNGTYDANGIGTVSSSTVFGNYPSSSSSCINLELFSGSVALVNWTYNGTTRVSRDSMIFTYKLQPQKWTHVIVVNEIEDQKSIYKLYVDGDLVETITDKPYVHDLINGEFGDSQETTRKISVGGSGKNNFNGGIIDVALYSDALTAEEVKSSYANGVNTRDENLIAYYDMKTSVGSAFIPDLSGNNHHASQNDYTAVEGGRWFNWEEDALSVVKNYEDAPVTISAEVFLPETVAQGNTIFGNYYARDIINFEIFTNGNPALYINEKGTIHSVRFTSVDVRGMGWVKLTVVYDKNAEGAGKYVLYVNGEPVTDYALYENGTRLEDNSTVTHTFELDMEWIQRAIPFTLGRDAAKSFRGKIRNLALYSEPLSAEDVLSIHQNGVDTERADMIAYYDLDADTTTESFVLDETGNGYDMAVPFFEKRTETADYAYSFAFIGDTQFLIYKDIAEGTTENASPIYDWIIENKDSKNIQYVFGLGDVTDKNLHSEWTYALKLHQKLGNAGIPYAVIPGNHDGLDTYVRYNDYFAGEQTLTKNITGYYEAGKVDNYYSTFEVGDHKYMVIVLQYGAPDEVLVWANNAVAENSDRRVIVLTHGYIAYDGTLLDDNDSHSPSYNNTVRNSGVDIWEKFVSRHSNIIISAAGHIDPHNIKKRYDVGVNGNTVCQFLIDNQALDRAAAYDTGMVAMFYFSEDGSDVQVEYVSTTKTLAAQKKGKTDTEIVFREENQFSFEVDLNTAVEDRGEIDVWLIGGQSNAVGYATDVSAQQALDIRYFEGFDNVLYYGYSQRWISNFVPTRLGLGYNDKVSGPEIGIAEALGDTGRMNAVVKYAYGATYLYPDTESRYSQNYGTWTSPSYIENNNVTVGDTKIGLMYTNFIATVESACAQLKAMGYTPVIRGMWWMQGEAECSNSSVAAEYEELLGDLISDVRSDVGSAVGADLSAMPFVIGRVLRNPSTAQPEFIGTVQAAQDKIASTVSGAAIVNAADFEGCAQIDEWHYNAETQGYLGRSFVERAIALSGGGIVESTGRNVLVSGGGIYKNGESVTVSFAAAEGYSISSVKMKVGDGEPVEVELTEGSYSFISTGERVEFIVETEGAEDEVTEYGTIPGEYSKNDYPFAVFSDNALLGVYSYYGGAIKAAYDELYGVSGEGKEVTVVLRRDYTTHAKDTSSEYITYMNGELTLDLLGNTFVRGAGYLFDIYAVVTDGELFVTTLRLVNGTVIYTGSPLVGLNYSSASSLSGKLKSFDMYFEKVRFELAEDSKCGSGFITACWENGTNGTNVGLEFVDCIFDLTNAPADAVVLNFAGASKALTYVDATVRGGEIIAGRNATVFVKTDSGDSFAFGRSNGKYTVLKAASDADISGLTGEFISDELKVLKYELVSEEGGVRVYEFTESEPLQPESTPYGDISTEYLSAETYPFAIFAYDAASDSYSFVEAVSGWATALTTAHANSPATILLRTDYTTKSTDGTSGLIRGFAGDVTVDFADNVFRRAASGQYLIDVYVNVSATASTVNYKFKNGTVEVEKWLIGFSGYSSCKVDKEVNFTFENVDFELLPTFTSANGGWVFSIWTSASTTKLLSTEMIFNDCSFNDERRASAISTTPILDINSSKFPVEADVQINGGEFISTDFSVSKLYRVKAYSADHPITVKFGVGNEERYMTVQLPATASAPDVTDVVLSDTMLECAFAKPVANGGDVMYSLCPAVAAYYSIKTSVTLHSNFIYNIYVPASEALTGIKLDGILLDENEYTENTVMIGDVEYYKISVPLAAKESLRDMAVSVSLASGDSVVNVKWTVSIMKYSDMILSGDHSEAEKTLMRDMLSYARAAYNYFGAADTEAEKLAEIGRVLGEGYDEDNAPVLEGSEVAPTEGLESATFVLNATPAIRFCLESGADASAYSFYLNGVLLEVNEPVTEAGLTYIDIDMYAYKMCDTITYTIDGEAAGDFHIRSYYEWANAGSDEKLKNVVARFWKYTQSAREYRNSITGG